MSDKDDIVKMLTPPPTAAAPFVHVELKGNQIMIGSNIPNTMVQLGVMVSAIIGMVLQGANQQQPSRIIQLS